MPPPRHPRPAAHHAPPQSQFTLSIPITRDYTSYLWDHFFTSTVICAMSFSAFALRPSEVADRLGLLITVFLVLVAYKMSISASLPKVRPSLRHTPRPVPRSTFA